MSGDYLYAADYCVRIVSQATCERLTRAHHYAHGCAKQSAFRHGLYRIDDPETVLGIAHWIPPMRWAAEQAWDGDFREVLSLSRLVIVPDMPTNAASFLIGQSIRLIAQDGRYRCLITYADTQQGHTGNIYRATNWEYLGLTPPKPVYVNAEGVIGSREMGGKTRSRAEMQAAGFELAGMFPKHRFRMVLPSVRDATPRGQRRLLEVSS